MIMPVSFPDYRPATAFPIADFVGQDARSLDRLNGTELAFVPGLVFVAQLAWPYLAAFVGATGTSWQLLSAEQKDLIASKLASLGRDTFAALQQALFSGDDKAVVETLQDADLHRELKDLPFIRKERGLPPQKPEHDDLLAPYKPKQESPKPWQIEGMQIEGMSVTPSKQEQIDKRVQELQAEGVDPYTAQSQAKDEYEQSHPFGEGKINPDVGNGGINKKSDEDSIGNYKEELEQIYFIIDMSKDICNLTYLLNDNPQLEQAITDYIKNEYDDVEIGHGLN
jgi:hypothetical protein